MAGRHFEFKPGGGDPAAFFRGLAPTQLVGTVSQVISMISMPLWARDPATVPVPARRNPERRTPLVEGAIGGVADPEAAAYHVAGKLAEGLDVENIPDTGEFIDGARLNMRNALSLTWTALPETRRSPAEAERIVRLAISGQFALFEDIRQELAIN